MKPEVVELDLAGEGSSHGNKRWPYRAQQATDKHLHASVQTAARLSQLISPLHLGLWYLGLEQPARMLACVRMT
eukprot:499511-Pelagomonas_calceolata.AAC.1